MRTPRPSLHTCQAICPVPPGRFLIKRHAYCLAYLLFAPLLLCCGASPLFALIRDYGQQSWQSDAGLPQNTVHAILQTHDGFLWIATEAGLVRFDGTDFRTFDTTNTPAFASDFIRDLAEDSTGVLWAATPLGLVREQAGTFTSAGVAQGLPSASILKLHTARNRSLIILTSRGAAELQGSRFVTIPGTETLAPTEDTALIAEGPGHTLWLADATHLTRVTPLVQLASTASPPLLIGPLQALAADSTGALWLGGTHGLAVQKTETAPTVLTSRNGLPSDDITCLLPAANGEVWIGTSKGLAHFMRGALNAEPAFSGMRIEKLFLDRTGALWVSTDTTVARLAGKQVDFSLRKPIRGVTTIFEDREGSMWFGTDADGLHLLRQQTFSAVTTEDGLSASIVRAVFVDHAGTLWIGTSGGGLDSFAAGKVSHFPGILPSKVILALAETHYQNTYTLWLGTPEGLVRVQQGTRAAQTRTYTTADGLADDFVRSLYADCDGTLWIGTRNGLSHFTGQTFHSYSRLDGLASDLIGAILRTRSGGLLIGTLGGLDRMTGETFVDALPPGHPAPSAAVTALHQDASGTLWFGTSGAGLQSLQDGKLLHYSIPPASANAPADSLPATIYGMLEDAQRNLWLSSRNGIVRVNIDALQTYAQHGGPAPAISHYDAADGMRLAEASGGGHPAAAPAPDGALWFATLNGAAVVHPSAALANRVPPLAAIEDVLIENQPQSLTASTPLQVSAGHGRLAIHYSSSSFLAPQKNRYRYILSGFDKNWIEAGNGRSAFYTNVPPGTYRFLVFASNNDGLWSTSPAEVAFTVAPYFYQTLWFYALATLTLASIGYLLYRSRVHAVQSQYQAVLAERTRIAREIHDTLAQGYVAIGVQLELAEHLIHHSIPSAVERLQQTRELVRTSLSEARSSIWNLRAQSDAATLPARLATHTASLSSRLLPSTTTLKFTVHGTYRPLTRTLEDEVFRIAQEAVANAVTHARATCIQATLTYSAHTLELLVTDDGLGLAQYEQTPREHAQREHAQRGHFGIQGMRERATRISAQLHLGDALPGKPLPGTALHLLVPLDSKLKEGD